MSRRRELHGKVVVVTGAARGIGFATASALMAQGMQCAIGDIDEVALNAAVDALGPAHSGLLDVTEATSFDAFLAETEARVGPIYALINNAGIMPVGRVIDETDASTRRMIDINLYGVIVGSKLAAQRMLQRGEGHVVNIASLAGEVPAPGLATYCATKAGVLSFTNAARLEHRGTGIYFSSVAPSFVNTDLTAGTSGVRGMRNAEPEDIAAAVVSVLRRPRPTVRRTRAMGALVGSQRFMPRGFNEAIARRLGAESVFLDDVDVAARSSYEDRVRSSTSI